MKVIKRISLILIIIWLVTVCIFLYNKVVYGGGRAPYPSFKTEGVECNTSCVIDDEGWIGDPTKLGKQLKNSFFNKTGVQPFIKINKFMPYFSSQEEGQAYAENWYANNIQNQSTFLLMYFPERDPNHKGVFAYVVGEELKGFVTEEFLQEFNDSLEDNWEKSSDTDEMFVSVYSNMADWAIKGESSSFEKNKPIFNLSAGVSVGVIIIGTFLLRRRKSSSR